MWRTDPRATLTNPEALAAKILEKGWKHLSQAEKTKARAWTAELQLILPKKTGDGLLSLLGQKRTQKPQPRKLGKTALIKKIKTAFKKKRLGLTSRSDKSKPLKSKTP